MNLDAKQEKENLWLVTKMCNFLDDYANAKRASYVRVLVFMLNIAILLKKCFHTL